MKWDKSFCVGCQIIDSQHEQLVNHVDSLEKLIGKSFGSIQLAETLKFMVDYARTHFHDEEELMSRIGYPELDRQKMLHDELIEFVTNFLLDLKVGNPCELSELVNFLTGWITEHVLAEDMKIGEFIRLHQIKC